MKAAGALQVTFGFGSRAVNMKRLVAIIAALYLLILPLAPVASAQSTGEIDLELVKTVNPTVVELGDNATWTITVNNAGPGDATGVEVGDILPAGLTYVSHSGDGNLNPAAGTWTIGLIPAGGSVALQIVTSVDALGEIVNEAEVTMADQDDVDSTPGDGEGDDWDDAMLTSMPNGSDIIDLELTKSADPTNLTVGGETTWTVDLVNQGPQDATGVEVGVAVPAGVTYVSHSGDGTFDAASGAWTVGDLAVGQTVSLAIVTTVDIVGDITCSAEVTMADQEDVDSTPGDGEGDDWDDATVTSTPSGGSDLIDLELTKSADPVNLTVGDATTWTVDLINQGPDDATGVEVTVTPPSGVTYVSHSGDGAFDAASGAWTVGDLAVGASVTLAIVTTVDVEGDLTCTAEVTMADQEDIDSTPGDGEGDDWDDATVTSTPSGGGDLIDLELTKSADPANLRVGDETTWTVDLINQGPDDATGVEVTVAPPSGVTYASHSGDGSFDPVSGLWTVGDLAVGESVSLAIVTGVDTVGDLTCTAEVTKADQEDVDSTPGDGEGDDWDDATITSVPSGGGDLIDLELTKDVDPAIVEVGDETTWIIELVNQGPDDATGVEVTVAPPAEVTYVSHIGLGDFDPLTGVWTVGDLAVGETITLSIATTVDVDGTWTCVAEVTAADQEDIDSVPGDGEGDDWDDATVTTDPLPPDGVIDLELTKSADPTVVAVGETTTWTVELTNQGPDDASGVAVTVSPPPQVTYASHAGDGDFDPVSGVWTVGDLVVGQTVTLAIVTEVDEVGVWTCEAEVTAADQEDIDSTPGDGEGDDWDDAMVEASSVLASAIIGDTVWLDDDTDGVQDAGESGLAGAVVELTNLDNGEVSNQTTNEDGLYLFSALDPGSYTVAIQMSSVDEGLGMTTPGSFTITLADNDAVLTADFGLAEQLPATGFDPVPFSVGGLILVLLGAVALELTWPEREGRRLFGAQNTPA